MSFIVDVALVDEGLRLIIMCASYVILISENSLIDIKNTFS